MICLCASETVRVRSPFFVYIAAIVVVVVVVVSVVIVVAPSSEAHTAHIAQKLPASQPPKPPRRTRSTKRAEPAHASGVYEKRGALTGGHTNAPAGNFPPVRRTRRRDVYNRGVHILYVRRI